MKKIIYFIPFFLLYAIGIGVLYAFGYYACLNHQDWNPMYFSLGLIPIVILSILLTALTAKKMLQQNGEPEEIDNKQISYPIIAKRILVISLFAFVVYSYGYLIGGIGYEWDLVGYLLGGLLTIAIFSPGYQIYYIYYKKK